MPITEEQMTYEEMKRIVSNPRYHCGECDGQITLAYGGSLGFKGYIIRCANSIEHSTISKYNKKEEEYMQEAKDQSALSSTALTAMTETAMVERIEKGKFPKDLTVPEKKLLAVACITYGFDPIMHELTIFQGNPFVSVDGRYRKAQETGQLDGMSCRPATKEEREQWEIPEGDKFCRAECYRKDASHPFVGWGRVFEKEMVVRTDKPGDAYKPIVTNPLRMAEKRAEVQALRKAFHIPLPSAEYIGVDTITGEILNGKVIDAVSEVIVTTETPEPVAEAEEKAEELFTTPEPKAKAPKKDNTPVTATQLRDIQKLLEANHMGGSDLQRWCNDAPRNWGIQVSTALMAWQYDEVVKAFKKDEPS